MGVVVAPFGRFVAPFCLVVGRFVASFGRFVAAFFVLPRELAAEQMFLVFWGVFWLAFVALLGVLWPCLSCFRRFVASFWALCGPFWAFCGPCSVFPIVTMSLPCLFTFRLM